MNTAKGQESQELLRNALIKIKELKAQIRAQDAKVNESIAIIGMACHFPAGARNPVAFWQALAAGEDGVRRIPVERWPADAIDGDKLATRWAGLLESLDQFDAGFFGISPREASHMDPQQRMLLEVAWEALEASGQPANHLSGTKAGVFIGIMGSDYAQVVREADPFDMYSGIGNAPSVAAGRLSYSLGLQGPSMVVDTACSSSLVAVHLGCQSLRNRESDLALAGGVNAIIDPLGMAIAAEIQALSPDGRCKTFDAEANGFVRGEGCGIVVLKRLADAERDGDPILAVIRGSVVNQDGRSTGLTAPNVLSQQAMLRRALEIARLAPEDIGYVETHGTGTPLGDPIEFEALREVIGAPRADGSTCVLGALKTNVGHMEGAAGIGGLIKAILCLQHEAIPKNLHFKTLNPRISLEGTPFVIPTETIPWKSNGKLRRAGVSSFGISGTNAHVILEEAPRREEKPFQEASSYLLPLSAKTPGALTALARSYQEWLLQNDAPLHYVAYTASMRRTHLDYRLGVVGSTKEEIVAVLGVYANGEQPLGIVTGKAAQSAQKVVFVFPGQGSQWVGMGRQLYREESAYRNALAACDEAIRKEAGFSIVDELDKPEETSRLSDIDVVQPVLFTIQVALVALWRSWGVEPAAVVGHSMGEIAAAFVAGALSMEDAAAIICRRSRLLRKVSGQGAMALVELTFQDSEKALQGYGDRLSVAVSNGPRSTVIAGDPAALEEVLGKLEREGVFCRRVKVDVASHSPQMDPLRDDLLAALTSISPKPANIPMRSTVTGQNIQSQELSGEYWADNLRKPVLFSKVVASWIADGQTIFIEMSPHPILLPSVEENLREANAEGVALASMRRAQDERQTMLSSLGALFVRGVPVAWKSFFPDNGRVVDLPTYPWQRKRYWIDNANPAKPIRKSREPSSASHNSLLGRSFSVVSLPNTRFRESAFRLDQPLPLADHCRQGVSSVSWSAQLEVVLEGARAAFGDAGCTIDECTILDEPAMDNKSRVTLQLALESGHDKRSFTLGGAFQSNEETAETLWNEICRGVIRKSSLEQSPVFDLEKVPKIRTASTQVPAERFYATLAARGLTYTSTMRVVQQVWTQAGEALGRLIVPADLRANSGTIGFVWALLDGCTQLLHAALAPNIPPSRAFRVQSLRNASFWRSLPPQGWAMVRVRDIDANGSLLASFVIVDDAGHVVMQMDEVQLEPLASNVVPEDLDDPATVLRILRRIIGQVAALHDANMDVNQQLLGAGVDSLMFVQILRRIEQAFGVTISSQTMQRFGMALIISTLQGLSDFVIQVRRAATEDSGLGSLNLDAMSREAEDEHVAISVEAIIRESCVSESYRALFDLDIPVETWMVSLSTGETIEVLCAGSGEPLVLMPPILASIPIWVFQVIEFSRTHRVIVPNYPGYGRSTAPRLTLPPIALARRLHALLDAFGLDKPVDVVGWSLGGMAGQEFALAWPHRLRSLALVNTTSHLEEEDSVKNMSSALQRLRADLANPHLNQDAVTTTRRTRALAAAQKEASMDRSFRYAAEVLRFDASRRIHAIRVPTLVVQGLQDTLAVPRYGRHMAAAIAGAKYHEFADGGHFVPLHCPTAFNDLLRVFLTRPTP